MWSSVAVVAILQAAASAVSIMPRSDASCSTEEMENPLIKCACVEKGYGSSEDRAQCLGHESGYEFRLQRVKRWDQVCEPGITFRRDCNICKCNTQGNKAVCTLKICYKICRPGTLRYVDCNVCLCHQNSWKCTKKACPQPSHVGRHYPTHPDPYRYTDPRLTSRGDPSQPQPRPTVAPWKTHLDLGRSQPRDPGHDTLDHAANPRNGPEPRLTSRDDPSQPQAQPQPTVASWKTYLNLGRAQPRDPWHGAANPGDDFSCSPGTTYKDKCNTCWCAPDGKPGTCTKMHCPAWSY